MLDLLSEQMLVLFAILALGTLVGQISIRRISIGSAGVLFIALGFGHFGYSVPKAIMDLGLLLFVYAVGLQAGPRFFRTFRRDGIRFVLIGTVIVVTGALATLGIAAALGLPGTLAAGLYSGALTCTPGLAAAIDTADHLGLSSADSISVGYGIAYPFSMIGVVLLMQALPRLTGADPAVEKRRWDEEHKRELPALLAKTYRITNSNCDGISLRDLDPHRMANVNISRIRRGQRVSPASPDVPLALGDLVMAVGEEAELEKLRLLIGEETDAAMDKNTNVLSLDMEVSDRAIAGKAIAQLHIHQRYGVVITRIRRQGMEIAPTGSIRLEMGDSLRVVGERSALDIFARRIGAGGRQADETNMLPFLGGLLAGILIGTIPIPIPGGVPVRLSIAGGAFAVGLLIGHFGGFGPLRLHVPIAAKNLSRELGLMLFLAGAGTAAGARLLVVIQQEGWVLFAAGAVITLVSAAAGLLLTLRLYRMNLLSAMGAVCAGMTNPPGLNAANELSDSDIPTLAYASVYPVALIFKIVLAQVILLILP